MVSHPQALGGPLHCRGRTPPRPRRPLPDTAVVGSRDGQPTSSASASSTRTSSSCAASAAPPRAGATPTVASSSPSPSSPTPAIHAYRAEIEAELTNICGGILYFLFATPSPLSCTWPSSSPLTSSRCILRTTSGSLIPHDEDDSMLQQPATCETQRLHCVSRIFDAAGLCVKMHYSKLYQALAGSAAVNLLKSLVEASVQDVALKAEHAQAVAAPAAEKVLQNILQSCCDSYGSAADALQNAPRLQTNLSRLVSNSLNLATVNFKIFYLKIKSDYHRYLAEFKAGAKRKEAAENTLAAYKAVQDIALTELAPTNHAYQLFDEMPKMYY
uniref:14-3-3 domain-containing protein n=1 Tax=Ananas comosus var. bracteatus TaxID=296719 RepID=A0A6V7PL06_ANACO|nr:unnamed protein product [Ananas comosus var. bracteatus]